MTNSAIQDVPEGSIGDKSADLANSILKVHQLDVLILDWDGQSWLVLSSITSTSCVVVMHPKPFNSGSANLHMLGNITLV